MKTLKITLAAIVIAASATSAFADNSSGRGDRDTPATTSGTASYQVNAAPVYVAPVLVQDNSNPLAFRDHVNEHGSR
jgi:hypothetical protein